MCGIFGAVDFQGFFSPEDHARFVGLTDLIAYRGPDATGYERLCVKIPNADRSAMWDAFLGHRRLAIIDLSDAGRQPMTDGQGRWITFNGEIFNYLELRRELQDLGEQFRTATDTEVLLRIYSLYGPQGFAKLNGMWAFALVDLPARRVVLSRDRFSIKPLYYTREGSRVYFASEIKQLLPVLAARRMNERVMQAYLAQSLLDHTPETFFEGVYRVPAKSSLLLSVDDGAITPHTYWDHSLETVGTFNEAAEQFRELLEDSVRIRLRSDVTVGSLLSGGLDSSAVATLCRKGGADVETFSVISDDRRFSEEDFIDSVTRQTGVPNHKLTFQCPDLLQTLDRMLFHNDEPVVSLSIVAPYNIFRLVGEHHDVTVLLSGQGADEILLGYSKFFFFYLRTLLQKYKWGTAVKELLASFLRGTVVRYSRLADARRYIPALNSKPYGGALRLATDHQPVPIWQSPDLRQRQISDIDLFSVPALTRYEDRNSMAYSLEVRNPFLDHRLVNFVTSLPADYKIRNGWTKYILRESFPDLPPAVRWRKDKKAFVTAEEKWIRGDLRPLVETMFKSSHLQQMGVIDDRKFLVFYNDFLRGNSTHFGDISRALIAELWARNILERSESSSSAVEITSSLMQDASTNGAVKSTVV